MSKIVIVAIVTVVILTVVFIEAQNGDFVQSFEGAESATDMCKLTILSDDQIEVNMPSGLYAKGSHVTLRADPICKEGLVVDDRVVKSVGFDGWFDRDMKLLSNTKIYDLYLNEDTTIYAGSYGGVREYIADIESNEWTATSLGYTKIRNHYTGDLVFEGGLSLFEDRSLGEIPAGRYDVYKNFLIADIPMIDGSKIFDGHYERTYKWRYGGQIQEFKISGMYSDLDPFINVKADRWPDNNNERKAFVDSYSVSGIANKLMSMCSSLPDKEKVDYITRFVQANIIYADDDELNDAIEYWRTPIQTLFDGRGDCEDSGCLLAALLKAAGFRVALFDYDYTTKGEKLGHIAAGVALDDCDGDFYTKNGVKYYYREPGGSYERTGDSWSLYFTGNSSEVNIIPI